MLPSAELNVAETTTFEGEATMLTLAIALDTAEVVRVKEVPRRTRNN